ncbi:DUF1810 domain-containing protein [Polycladidibacter hongkongensis]|uniref:DUF1810 domain-containing protein n=1 Tax=Polycladidibacter hongkongensis TaxID=1647556 RepID=UPI00082EA3EC|nr:DUF1810 family protein [Pseudovibrio hongkongensis]
MSARPEPTDIKRFLWAQRPVYRIVVQELCAGAKQSHWMWFIFPQLRCLARSATADYFGIADLQEAKRYLQDSLLRERLLQCFALANGHGGLSPAALMGKEIDARKLRACASLFAATHDEAVVMAARRCLKLFFANTPCAQTLQALELTQKALMQEMSG